MIHISLKSEKIFSFLNFPFTNSLILSIIVLVLSLFVFFYYSKLIERPGKNIFYYFMTFILRAIYNLFKSIFNENVTGFFPLVGSFFFFILIHNEIGLLPGIGSILIKVTTEGEKHLVPLLRGGTTDLNTTFA